MARNFAMVTGASSGIGFSLANELASRGYDVIVAAAGDRLASTVESLRVHGTEIIAVRADLATREGVDALWQQVEQTNRQLDIACLNAGVGVGGLFSETNLDEEINMIELELRGYSPILRSMS